MGSGRKGGVVADESSSDDNSDLDDSSAVNNTWCYHGYCLCLICLMFHSINSMILKSF